MTKIALLIEWDPVTGERAGNINPRDSKLRCNGWQNMGVTPAIELRLVNDNRDLSIYDSVVGVTVVTGTDNINAAINANFPSKISIEDELLYTEHFKEKVNGKKINIDKLPNNHEERLKELKSKYGIKGIVEIKPLKV